MINQPNRNSTENRDLQRIRLQVSLLIAFSTFCLAA